MRIIDIVGALIASVELLRPHCDRLVQGYLSPLEAALQLGSDIVLLLKRVGTEVFSARCRVAKGLHHSQHRSSTTEQAGTGSNLVFSQPCQLKVLQFSFRLETVRATFASNSDPHPHPLPILSTSFSGNFFSTSLSEVEARVSADFHPN